MAENAIAAGAHRIVRTIAQCLPKDGFATVVNYDSPEDTKPERGSYGKKDDWSKHRRRDQRATAFSSTGRGDSVLRNGEPPASTRTRRACSIGDDRATKPVARGYDYLARPVQEIPLASGWPYLLSTAPVVRQTL